MWNINWKPGLCSRVYGLGLPKLGLLSGAYDKDFGMLEEPLLMETLT